MRRKRPVRGLRIPHAERGVDEPCICGTRFTCMATKHKPPVKRLLPLKAWTP